MKPVAAVLSLVLLALPLRAAAQQPSSVYDLKGPIRDYVVIVNGLLRVMCDRTLAARDEVSLQRILNEVDSYFVDAVEKLKRIRKDLADLRAKLAEAEEREAAAESESPGSSSPGSMEEYEKLRDLSSYVGETKWKYGRDIAKLFVLEQLRERVRGCVGLALDGLRQSGVTAGTGTGAGSGTGGGSGGATGQGAELCQRQAGPLGCTGRFSGTYQVECGGGSGPPSRDSGTGSVVLFSDGTVELRLQGGTSALKGRIDSSGQVSIVEGDGRFSQRWDGRFAVRPAPGGGSRLVGGGTYESRVTGPQGQLNNRCEGTFILPAAPS